MTKNATYCDKHVSSRKCIFFVVSWARCLKTLFSRTMERATDLLEIIHTDVCGPMSVEARGGYRNFLTVTDDLSRYGYIYFMKHKFEIIERFKEFQSEVEKSS